MTAISTAFRTFRADRRAGIAVFIALLFPALIAMGLLAIDAVRAFSQSTLLSTATQAAALAGGMNVGNYYSQGASVGASVVSAEAALIGDASAASAADFTSAIHQTLLGNWNAVNSTFTSLATTGTTSPNAVQVTGTVTMPTYFGGAFGTPTLTITKTATATYGSNKVYNVIMLNDMGGPNTTQSLGIPGSAQSLWWAQQQAADLAIMKCLQSTGNTSSKFGVTAFVEQAYTTQPLTTVNSGTNAATISASIRASQYCRQTKIAHNCHGSNVAAAILSAISQFKNISTSGASNNIIILTNEVPVYDPTIASGQSILWYYNTAEGTGVSVGPGVGPDGVTLAGTGSSQTPICGQSPLCNSTFLKPMAEAQAAVAGSNGDDGMNLTISVVYFSGDNGTPKGAATSYWTEISSWVKNNGMAEQTSSLTTTTTNGQTTLGVVALAGKFCQNAGSTLRTASP